MTLGPDQAHGSCITSLEKFRQKGYNEPDTARSYDSGRQETFTRGAGWKERGLSMATKWYSFGPCTHRPEVLEGKLEEPLRELGTANVDIFYLHRPDQTTAYAEKTLQTLERLHHEGKLKQLGLSNFSAFAVADMVTNVQ
ncbi:hypothetical protein BBP40_010356 [Aspergillus hancockii]|nr:hypothetical protein BBP40_010356 [Aspergillus hancockii]